MLPLKAVAGVAALERQVSGYARIELYVRRCSGFN
jgi:hypothetical protein